LSGEIPTAVLQQDIDRARELALKMDKIFGRDHFFLEVQDNGLPEQSLVNSALIRLAGKPASRWPPPTTAITWKKKTPMRTRYCSACRPASA
jgi:hypothetical protein